MQDPFVGTWKLNVEKSAFDANHRPSAGTMVFERDAQGCYLMKAEGLNGQGQKVAERPQRFVPDGHPQPIPDLPGLVAVTTQPVPNKLQSAARREDGSIAGEGTYEVSEDGKTLTASAAGFDTQLRRFEVRTVWDRA
ncbi:MAG TPA: hypothetical protein VMJ75_25320 [Candidatus Acidoferrales bacterium]|nr:hypothetical protein [Candidatus Acidoferrales bacterium]